MSNSVPEGWVNGKFGDLARVQNGYAFKSSDFSERGYAAAIRMSNLKNGRIDLSDARYVSEGIVNGLDQFRLSEGDFLFGMSGSLDNYGWITSRTGVCYLNQRVGCLRVKPKTDSLFSAYCYLSETVKREIVGLAAGAAQLNISGSQLEAIPVPVPPLPEQQKIAAILSSVDDVIEKTRAQIDKLKDLKTGMMQELLTKGIGHTEFKDSPVGRIPSSWDVVSLEQICIADAPITYGVLKPGPYVEGGKPLLQIRDLDAGSIMPDSLHLISDDLDYEYRRSRVEPGDIVISLVGTVGRTAIIPEWLKEPNIHRNLGRIRTEHNRLVYHFLQSSMALEQLGLRSSGSSQSALNLAALRQMLLPLPPNEEAIKITGCLDSIDQRISFAVRKYSKLVMNKKALMQDLLTGKVRVKIDEKEKESEVA